MSSAFLALGPEERREALGYAAAATGRPPHLLEKDVMVVWALAVLGASAYDEHLVFKGGTSLSKAYGAIARFSEDIDLTYDIRAIASDLIATGKEGLPASNNQQRAWTKQIRDRLQRWVETDVVPIFNRAIAADKLKAKTEVRDNATLVIEYAAVAEGTGYVEPRVRLEFGARSTGEPAERREIVCDAAESLPELNFPTARPRVMLAERTFWEKATAIHVFCKQGRFRGGERFARHWYDLVRLDDAGIAARALADAPLAAEVARHKQIFFTEKDETGATIDYAAAVTGALALVPHGEALQRLATDYAKMVEDGLLLDEAAPFEELMARCAALADRANASNAG
ncbi:MAG TPA: nucleotidyl transferase AbiEii/AbiGii toxin family protein [Sphingomonas sp.]|nr:nucleotidyl transferase AbiEii/AbiGii toxin family protein [Sphingomonas sp.]